MVPEGLIASARVVAKEAGIVAGIAAVRAVFALVDPELRVVPHLADGNAEALGVSRQVIVQDIAILRAAGEDIIATPQGYILHYARPDTVRGVVAVRHTPEQTEDELNLLVDAGVEVVDVIVQHPIYGEFRGMLRIASREDAQAFMERLRVTGARLLSELTDGLHLHTLEARDPAALERAKEALRERGYLVED